MFVFNKNGFQSAKKKLTKFFAYIFLLMWTYILMVLAVHMSDSWQSCVLSCSAVSYTELTGPGHN